jgi:hypothetical protein
MILYLSIFFIITLLYFNTIKQGGLKTRGLIIVMALLALFVGFGDMLGGYDRYIYGEFLMKLQKQDSMVVIYYFVEYLINIPKN